MDRQQEFALRTVEERDVRFIRLWFTDVLGTLKSVAIAPAELEAAFEEGIGFDGSAIEGMTRVLEDDMIVKPDPSTFQILPWHGGPEGTARMFCDVLTPDGEPSLGDPRHVLKTALAKAKEKGFTFYVHPEIEFYLFEAQDDWSKAPVPIDEGGYFDHVPRSSAMDFRRSAVSMLEQMGISVEYSHHEGGPGQNEIDLRYADALTTADNIMTFRTVVKEISLERGMYASFMPKPLTDQPGSGMHTHLSLFEGDTNAFYEAGQEFNMSLIARQFAAGILHHASEICAVTDQYVNSYKRLWGGAEAPSYVCWGHSNRSALLRVPQYKPGKGNSCRMEFRALDPVANPYLAYSVLLAAGLDGIEKQMTLCDPTSDDVWELTDAERQAMGIQPLPESLDEALKIMERSDFVASVLGEHAFEYFLRNKHQEWEEYRRQVTPFELEKYLPRLQRDDLLERCDLARESNSERELAQTESPVDFPCKLSSECVTRASVAWRLAGGFLECLCDIGITYLAALRSYTLFGLSGCIVKFSFLITFSAEIVFINKIITIVPLLYCSTSNSYLPLVNPLTVVL